MDRESLKKSGLLEQYILGIASRKEALLVERTLAENPEAREDYEKLREELDAYANSSGMFGPLEGRENRSIADYEDLDHEMILAMTERNHTLTVWRYALMGVCFFLLCLSGYLFRLSETSRSEVVTERAHHAQDNNAHEKTLRHLEEMTPDWDELKTIKSTTADGTVIVHYLDRQNLVMLDFSHAQTLEKEESYFVFAGREAEEALFVIPAGHQLKLHPAHLPHGADEVRVFRAKSAEKLPAVRAEEHLVMSLSLPDFPEEEG